MSQKTIEYQTTLIKQSIAILKDALNELGQGIELRDQTKKDIAGIVISQMEDVRDISWATTEAEKTKIMKKWL
jgi:hypothetical protein